MDLGTILLEYQCNYLSRLQKKPKLVRQIFPEEKEKKSATVAVGKKPQPRWPTSAVEGKEKKPKPLLSAADLPNVTGTKLEPFAPNHDENFKSVQLSTPNCVARLNAAMAVYEGQHGNELLDLAVTISREMFLEDPNVHWDDIKGMEDAKRLIKEAIVYPVRYPELFKGILAPWRGLLLTGPPGTHSCGQNTVTFVC
jgi:ATP-dependent Zn protease